MAFAVRKLSFLLQCRPAVITHLSKHLQSCYFKSDYCNIKQPLPILLVIATELIPVH